MNLIAAEFGLVELAGHDDGAAGGVNLHGVLEGVGFREGEKLLEHLDHVLVGVLVVVEQHDVVEWRELVFFFLARTRSGRYARHRCFFMIAMNRAGRCYNRINEGGRNGFDGIESSWKGVPGSELP